MVFILMSPNLNPFTTLLCIKIVLQLRCSGVPLALLGVSQERQARLQQSSPLIPEVLLKQHTQWLLAEREGSASRCSQSPTWKEDTISYRSPAVNGNCDKSSAAPGGLHSEGTTVISAWFSLANAEPLEPVESSHTVCLQEKN